MPKDAPVNARTTPSTAEMPFLIAFPRVDAYQCGRCGKSIEVPRFAVLAGGARPVRIQRDPLNHLLWLEEQAAKHQTCSERTAAAWTSEPRVWRMA